MIRISKTQKENLKMLLNYGSAVMASEWTTGSGNYIKAKAVPPFCERIECYQNLTKLPKRIRRVFWTHPRCRAVIAITNMRAAKRAIKSIDNI